MILALAASAHAQTAPAPAAPTARPADPVKEHEPVHLKERDGTLVPVLGYTLEDFDEFIELKNQLGRGQMRPRYTMQRLSASGSVTGQFARLQVECDVLVSASGWVRVPLRMPEAVLVQEAKYKGPTRFFMEFDGTTGGYAAWLFGGGEASHRLTLELLAPIEKLSGKQRLRLTAPRSAQSELKLSVPLTDVEAAVTGGAVLDNASQRPATGNATSLMLRALDGEIDLTWWAGTRKTMEATPDLEAIGVLLSKVDGRSVRTDATFTVRSSSGEFRFDSFRVRLPKGANLLPSEQPGIRIEGPTMMGGNRVVDINLDEPTPGPVEVRLSTEKPYNIAKKDDLVELAGFEVVDAVRQWGHIGVEVQEEWQIALAERRPGVRQVETLPESLREADLVAGFEYSGQPCTLQARVFARETRIAVEPEYEVRVESTRLHLKARLKYRVPGAKIFFVNIDLRGWETDSDRIGPASLVDQEQIAPQLITPLTIPLRQALKGEFELTLEAWKPIARDAATVDFYLPQPTAHNLLTPQVIVLPADNVHIVPQSEKIANLKSQSLPRKFHIAGRQQEPLFFLGDELQGHLVADFRRLPRVLEIGVQTTVTLSERDTQVEQKLACKASHEPIDRLSLEVPRHVLSSNTLEVSLDGRPLPLAEFGESNQPADPALMHAALVDDVGKPAEQIGPFEVLIRYSLPHEKLLPDASISLDVPLVMPAEGNLLRNRVIIAPVTGMKALPRKGAWSVSDEVDRSEPLAGLELVSSERLPVVPLAVNLESKESLGATVIERGWIYSQLSAMGRQDRAAFRFTTTESRFDLQLPHQVVLNEVGVLLDGQRVAARLGSDRRLSILLPKQSLRSPMVVEVAYRIPGGDRGRLSANLEAPRPVDDVWVRRLYWQVLLPPHQHVLAAPPGFVSESAWRFNGLYFDRQPLRSQADLETWCGVLGEAPDPTIATGNMYLFSTLGPVQELQLTIARRTWLVFGASSIALVLGLLLIYLPLFRRAIVLVIVAGVTSLGLVYPEPVLVLLQAASLGAALVLLASMLERVVSGRRRRSILPTRRSSNSSVDLGLAFDKPALAPAGAHSSTRTAAVAAAGPESGP